MRCGSKPVGIVLGNLLKFYDGGGDFSDFTMFGSVS